MEAHSTVLTDVLPLSPANRRVAPSAVILQELSLAGGKGGVDSGSKERGWVGVWVQAGGALVWAPTPPNTSANHQSHRALGGSARMNQRARPMWSKDVGVQDGLTTYRMVSSDVSSGRMSPIAAAPSSPNSFPARLGGQGWEEGVCIGRGAAVVLPVTVVAPRCW